MKLEDTFRMLCSAYYGIREMDEYKLKEYALKRISDYIKDFVYDNPINDFDYRTEATKVEDEWELKTKLQDSLIVLPKIEENIELVLMVKERLNRIREDELKGVI